MAIQPVEGASREAGSRPRGEWRVVAASEAGARHRSENKPSQDAYGWSALSRGVLIAAVADGSGSAPLGGLGAILAVKRAVDHVRWEWMATRKNAPEPRWDWLVRDALGAARAGLEEEAQKRSVRLSDLATTLLLAIATEDRTTAAQVGDGAIVILEREGSMHALTTPPRSEYVNETTFLTSRDYLDELQLTVWRRPAAHLALFSDGLQSVALRMLDRTPHAPFFDPLFQMVAEAGDDEEACVKAQLIGFLRCERVRGRTDDDVTLLLAAHVP